MRRVLCEEGAASVFFGLPFRCGGHWSRISFDGVFAMMVPFRKVIFDRGCVV